MRLRGILAFLLAGLLLAACGPASKWSDFYHEGTVPYYFYTPAASATDAPQPLLVVLLGDARSAAECFDGRKQIAEDRGLALICPALPRDSVSDVGIGEFALGEALVDVYQQANLQPRFFLAGFGEAGAFVLDYSFRYSSFVSGVSAMSVETFPEANAAAVNIPIQLTVGESDRDGQAAAEAAAESWRQVGLVVRVVTVQGNGSRPNIDFARLASELAHQTMVP